MFELVKSRKRLLIMLAALLVMSNLFNAFPVKADSTSTSTISIADARKLTSGNVTIDGIVTTVNDSNVFIQDNTAGICVYNSKAKAAVKKGDKIQVTGPLSVYNSLLEITPVDASNITTLSVANAVKPKVVNIADINSNLQSQLIELDNVTLTTYDKTADSTLTDSTGNIVIYKVPALSGISAGDKVNVIAAVSQYQAKYELTVDQASNVTKVSSGNTPTPAAATISVLATSDIHGHVLNFDYASNAAPSSSVGLAKASTYVNSVRKNNPNVMLIDDGDTIQGTPLSYYFDKIDVTSEYPLMKVMGAMKYDTWTLGNHEFNYGLPTLNRVISDANKEGINVLSANIYNSDNTNFVKPYYIKSFSVNGKTVKVGILGLTTKCIPDWEDPSHYAGLHFNDLVDEAKLWVPKVRAAGADIVIVAAHSGEESASDVIPENQVKAIATKVNGIDAIVAGHVHNTVNDLTLKNPDGKVVPVVEPNKWGAYVSQIDIALDASGKFTGLNTKNVQMDNTISEDQAIVQLIQPLYQAKTLAYTQTKLGTSTGEFKGDGQTVKPTPIMELINKVQKNKAGTQLSIAAPLSSAAYIPKGDVTIKDIMSVYVYENYLYGVKMTGKQLKDWMEFSVRYYQQVKNSSDPIAKDSILNVPDYNLDQLYGATYDVDLTKPGCSVDSTTGRVITDNRIKNLKIDGKLVKDTDTFTVAINDYRYNGGGGFMKAAGLSSTDPSIVTYSSAKALGDDGQVRSLMMSYITDIKTISPDCSNNWELSTTAVTQQTDNTTNPVTTPVVTPVSTGTTSDASAQTSVATNKLPQTGSMIDFGVLMDAGALSILLGMVLLVTRKYRKKIKKVA